MRVAIFGTGYVGLVTGACLAQGGHDVVCLDNDEGKIAALNNGMIPIYEPGLEPLVKQNSGQGRLRFTTDPGLAVDHGEVIFIAVGTPPDEKGEADLKGVSDVARTIGDRLDHSAIVVNKSTVPVGTADMVRGIICGQLRKRGVDVVLDVVSNPEFLKEGAAVGDFMRPDRIIIGTQDKSSAEALRRLYAPFNRNHDRIVEMTARSAELTKYTANAMLAAKISLMNEIAGIAEQVGADMEQVRMGVGHDPRIGWHFIYAGAGYGGSCFPKDVRALASTARKNGRSSLILDAVEATNNAQKGHVFSLMERHYRDKGGLEGKTIALWGLAFKPDTDDMREAPSRRLMDQLWMGGARVRAFDPAAGEVARGLYGDHPGLVVCNSAAQALEGADALVVMTEWRQFRSPDFIELGQALGDRVIFDGRNLYEPSEVEAAGVALYGVGRGRSVAVGGDGHARNTPG